MSVAELHKAVGRPSDYSGPIFDADTHIHERDFDFFKEYLPEKYHEDWLIRYARGEYGYGLYVGKTPVMPSMDEINEDGSIPPPGKLKEWLAALASGEEIKERFMPTPDFYHRKERMDKLDEWNVDGSLLFIGNMVGTIGALDQIVQEKGCEGANAVLHAYNQYMLDEWSFNANDRIYPTPMIALWDLEWAIQEAKWAIEEHGARIIVMPMGPAHDKAAADPAYDEFWKVLNDNNVVLSYHVSEACFMHPVIRAFGEQPLQSRRIGQTAWQWMFTYSEIPVMMTMASFIYLNFFERFPNIKMVSVENGCEWVPRFVHKMDKMRGMARSGYWPCGQMKERPSEVFKRHCFVVAYPEDNIKKVVDEIGTTDPILMGSDYPHAEGSPTPAEFVQQGCAGLTLEQLEAIMHTNGRRMLPRLTVQ